MSDRLILAKVVFSLDAAFGILSIGGAALYIAALGSGKGWTTFAAVLIAFSVLWLSFCYGAYKGLTSERTVLKVLFWSHVTGNALGFPVGTAIAGVCIWLWRELRRQDTAAALR